MAGTRVFVQEDIYDKFVKEAVHAAEEMRVGGPFEDHSFNGPLISQV